MEEQYGTGTTGARADRVRVVKMAPIACAVRRVLAVSAAAFALAGSGAAFAQSCEPPVDGRVLCDGAFTDPVVLNAVEDLTLVLGESGPTSVTVSGVPAGASIGGTGALGLASHADILVNNAGDAIGLQATSSDGPVSVTNTGDVGVTSADGAGVAMYAAGTDLRVENTGALRASGYDWAAGIEAEATGTATVVNSGHIDAEASAYNTSYAVYGQATGIEAIGGEGALVENNGYVQADGTFAKGIYAHAGGAGSVQIENSGQVDALAADGYAAGIVAVTTVAGGEVAVDSSGTVGAFGYNGANGIEVTALGEGATGSASNGGDIAVHSEYYGNSSGIGVSADAGASVGNAGSITVEYGFYAYGASAFTFNGDATVDNAGSIAITSGYIGYGVLAASSNGAGLATSSGDITVVSNPAGQIAVGIAANGKTAASLTNQGDVAVSGAKYSTGLLAVSSAGDVLADNGGSVAVDGKYAWGLRAQSSKGDVLVRNDGAIDVKGSKYATGLTAVSGSGSASATNAGDIAVHGQYAANVYGIKAVTDGGGDIVLENQAGATLAANAYGGAAFGIGALAVAGGDVSILNAGDVAVTGSIYTGYYGGTYGSVGVAGLFARADAGDVSIHNSGLVRTDNPYAAAEGVIASAGGDVAIDNSGDIEAIARGSGGTYAPGYAATGVDAYAIGSVAIVNSGEVGAFSGYGGAYGIAASAQGGVSIRNEGRIIVGSGDAPGATYSAAVGILAVSAGDVDVFNSGTIVASPYWGYAVGVRLAAGTVATLTNSGSIEAIRNGGSEGIAALGGNGVERIVNTGTIRGAVITKGGADEFRNAGGGSWSLVGTGTDFGDGDDVITNDPGGTIQFRGGKIDLGAGAGNRFDNAGTIAVAGDALIHMGSGASATVSAAQQAAVPSLNATPLVNSGVIDLKDGGADDSLTIVGDLGGNGSLDIDIDVATGASDLLIVDGSVAEGDRQTVNVGFDGFAAGGGPGIPRFTAVRFATVSGNAAVDSFIGGAVVGFDASNFLDLDVIVASDIDASNARPDVFSVGVEVAGLNDTGALATSLGSGTWSLMTSQIGTWRQRMGVVPEPRDGGGLSAFVRTFYDKGDVSPEHEAANFGQRGGFDYQQLNSGAEAGLNFEPAAGFNLGVTLGKSRGKQTLADPGIASTHVAADTFGLYGTWIGKGGWYADASYRAMRFDARLDSAGGRQRTDGKAGAINVETGYPFALDSGLRLEPQFQYTWTTVDGVLVQGTQTWLRTNDGDWHRSRLGLSLWQPFATGAGLTWTPYGTASVVRVDDAKSGYTVGDALVGHTSTEGTSALVELGVGLQKAGLTGTFGANWTDGGALESFLGGQLVLRYAW